MKCPRCGEVLNGADGAEEGTSDGYARFTCSACDDEMDDEMDDEFEDGDEECTCACARSRDDLAEQRGFPCDACGRVVS